MSRRRRREPILDEETPTSDPAPELGYREAPERPLAELPPEGELLEPTAEDQRALDSERAQARNRLIGICVAAWILRRIAVLAERAIFPDSTLLPFMILLSAIVMVGYAFWSRFNPRGIGPAIVRVEPEGEIGAGRLLTITVLLQPRQELELDPLKVQLVARRSGDGRQRPETIHVTEGIIADRQTIEGGQAVRLQTTLLVPEEAPPTSRKRGITWRVEVSIGAPAVFSHRVPIRVLPLDKRRRARAERMKARSIGAP
jgi:hypothetical protein